MVGGDVEIQKRTEEISRYTCTSPPSNVLSLALCEVPFYFFFESLDRRYFWANSYVDQAY